MTVTDKDLWNCLQQPERDAWYQALHEMVLTATFSVATLFIDPFFISLGASGLTRRQAWLDQVGLVLETCLDPEGNPYPCYTVANPLAWTPWITLFVADELDPDAACTIPLFP